MNVGDRFSIGPDLYEVVEQKGAGGFSIVFRAQPIGGVTGPDLAVKVLQPHYASDPPWRQRFEREARILANINHPNVVRIRATWPQPDGSLAIIQEYIKDSQDMQDCFQASGQDQHLSIVLQVLYGLRATHGTAPAQGAVHRDLSPANVLVDLTKTAKIIDFGLSKQQPRGSTILTVGYYFGTPGCIAPEQIADAATVDHRADFYALGRSIAASIQNRNPQHVDINLLSSPWREFCQSLTAHDAASRYQFANDAIRDLLFRADAAGIVPARMDLHFREFGTYWPTVPSEWSRTARKHLARLVGTPYELFENLQHVTVGMLGHTSFDATDLFPSIDRGVFEPIFGSGSASFGSTDRLGDIVAKWIPHLAPDVRRMAYQRLCRTAVRYHRYYLMGYVRDLYGQEPDATIKQAYLDILQAEDPLKVIEGRGVIPGR
jgi:serine/threonine protein kinase